MTFIIIFILFISTSIFSFSDSVYSVEEFLDFLTIEHTTPKILKSQRSVSTLDYTSALAITDWTFGTSIYSNYTQPYQTSSFISSDVNTFGSNFHIERPILSTGGYLNIGMSNTKILQSDIVFNGLTLNEGRYYENKLSVTYTQPLLYGLFGEVLTHPILVSSSNVEIVSLDTTEQFESFILDELNQYIDWALAYEVTELSFARLQLARESLKQTEDRVRVNLSEKIDLLRAEYSVQQAHQLWLTQKAHLKSIQFKFSSKLDNQILLSKVPKFDLYDTVYVKKPSYVVMDHLRMVQQLDLNNNSLKHQLALSQSKRNGTLNLSSTYDFLGGNDVYIDSLNYSNNNFTVALNYSRSLSDTDTISQVKKNQEQLNQHTHQRDQLLIDLESEILSLYTLTEEYKKILSTTLNQIITAQEKANAEQALYNQGRSTLDMVIHAQDNVLDSKLNYANLSATYQKLIINYQSLIDELLIMYDLSLNKSVNKTDKLTNKL